MSSTRVMSGLEVTKSRRDILEQQHSILRIPEEFVNLLPGLEVPVPAILDFTFPPIDTGSSTSKTTVSSHFHNRAPSEVGSDLIRHSVPDKSLYTSLQKDWLKFYECGFRSVSYASNNEPSRYYPFWILTWWELVLWARKKQQKWIDACAWLTESSSSTNHSAVSKVVIQAQHYISQLGWDTTIPFEPSCSAADLTIYLSNNWLATRHIDWMIEAMEFRLQSLDSILTPIDPQNPVLLFGPDTIRSIIQRFESIPPNISPEDLPRFLSPLQARIRKGERPRVYTVFNYSNVHWLALEIDFETQTIRYGDSMGGSHSSNRVRNVLKAWLKATWGYTGFSSEPMPCSDQGSDSSSCGVCAINTIESQVFGDQLWDEQLSVAYRASKFIEVAHRILVPKETMTNHMPHVLVRHALEESSYDDPLSDQELVAIHLPSMQRRSLTPNPPSSVPASSLAGSSDCESMNDIDHDEPEAEAPVSSIADEDDDLPGPNCKQAESVSQEPLYDQSSSSDSESSQPARKRQKPGKSAAYTRAALSAVASGNFEVDTDRWAAYEKKIKVLDPNALLDPKEPMYIRHSVCGESLKMRQPYDIKNFKVHVEAQTCRLRKSGASRVGQKKHLKSSTGAGMMPLTTFAGFKRTPNRITSTSDPSTPSDASNSLRRLSPGSGSSSTKRFIHICPGITEKTMPGVDKYILRTSYIGGGSRSYTHFAMALYSQPYNQLNDEQKQKVQNEAHGNVTWRIDESRMVVVSSACTRIARMATDGVTPRPCIQCMGITKDGGFKDALRYEAKPNQQFTNKRWMQVTSGMHFAKAHGVYDIIVGNDKLTPAQRFLKQTLQGKLKDRTVFYGMVEAMAMFDDKMRRGVGLQNSQYTPAFDEFCNSIVAISPLAYQTFRNNFVGRTAASFRAHRARDRRFPLDIEDKSVYDIAEDYLSVIGYKGPVSLSCDDTKLLPALRTYYDSTSQQWFLLGGTKGPIVIADTDELAKILQEGSISKAPKIRLWVLQVPLPHIPPLAIAALPIASTVSAPSLIGYLKTILNGLLDRGIQVVSYAADGSAVEQNIQEALFMSMDNYRHYAIPHPSQRLSDNPTLAQPDLDFKLGLFRGHPIVMIQDSKHALKTCRNNLYSGARLLVLGSEIAMYAQAREVAEDSTSTLHRRDVEHMDRQDDASAECLFNQLTLSFLVQHRPQYLGLVLYLYVLGELCDAYQSRHISHADRLWMALRAKFFLDFWRHFLQVSGYPTTRYFISQPAYNILSTVIEGLILLIYVYRDYMPTGCPLLPWLHSTEACEHMFAEMRKLIPDFTYLDFVFAVPKLRVLLRASYRSSPSHSASSAEYQKKGMGYLHTYMDSSGIDISLLSRYPSDTEIADIAFLAYREATLLAQAANILPNDQVPPPISETEPAGPGQSRIKMNQPSNTPDPEDLADPELSASEAFQELVELAEANELPLEEVSVRRDNLVYASAALQAENSALIDNLSSESEDDIQHDRRIVMQHADPSSSSGALSLEAQIPELNEETIVAPKPSVELNLATLVQIRKRHQNPRALKSSKNYAKLIAGVNLQANKPPTDSTNPDDMGNTPNRLPTAAGHASLARSFMQTLRDHEISTSKVSDRLKRWMTSDGATDGRFKGNTANAKQASETRANAYIKNRRDRFRQQGVLRLLEDLATARISLIQPIIPGSFVWVASEKDVKLGKVMAIYVKEGGHNGMNLWVPKTSHLGHISYVAIQLYQKVLGSRTRFRAIHFGKPMEIPHYQLVPANELLMLVNLGNLLPSDAQQVELKEHSAVEERDELLRLLPNIEIAIRAISRAGANV